MLRDRALWTWHVLAGLVILVFAGLHMTIMHLDVIVGIFNPVGGHPIDWANVVARGRTVFFPVTYVILLGAALFHGLYGLRNILLELNPAPWLAKTIGVVLFLLGFGLFAVGSWAALTAHTVAVATKVV
jgi:succinate dehydrogenase hydrophobic anchor subunit